MPQSSPSYPRGGYREVLTVAYPLIMSTASMTVMHFVDRVFLARYGQQAIAAAVPAGVASFTVICLFMGISGYTNAIVAQHYGAREYEQCSLAVWQGVIFSLVSYLVMVLFIPLGPAIFSWAGHSGEVRRLEIAYYTILLWGGLLVPLNSAFASFFTGRGDTKTTMVAGILGNGVNVFLDYCLIFGRFGFPEMGIEGAALATVISSLLPVLFLSTLFMVRYSPGPYLSRDAMRFDRTLFTRLLQFGTPAGVQFTLDIGAFTLFIMLVGRLGELELAVTNIALSINMLAFLPLIGISIATTTLVGQYIGKRDLPAAEKSTYSSLKIALLYMGSMGLVFILFPEQLLSLFRSSQGEAAPFAPVLDHGRRILVLVACYGFFDAMNVIFSGALKGAGDTRFAMWASVLVAWVLFVPPVYLIVEVVKQGILMAWGWATIYIIVIGTVFCFRFRSGKWKTIDLLARRETAPSLPPVLEEHLPHDHPCG